MTPNVSEPLVDAGQCPLCGQPNHCAICTASADKAQCWCMNTDIPGELLARVRAARMSYVGGPGYELYVPVEVTRHVYLALRDAGDALPNGLEVGAQRHAAAADHHVVERFPVELRAQRCTRYDIAAGDLWKFWRRSKPAEHHA